MQSHVLEHHCHSSLHMSVTYIYISGTTQQGEDSSEHQLASFGIYLRHGVCLSIICRHHTRGLAWPGSMLLYDLPLQYTLIANSHYKRAFAVHTFDYYWYYK